MPPRKKAKGSVRAASTPAADDEVVVADTPVAEPSKPSYDILKDPWTDEQETSLFKGIIKWKPAGIHKHFRMIALSEHLRNHGYDPRVQKHTSIPGIWAKLRTLYDLDVIDDRENAFDYEDPKKYIEFQIPLDDDIQTKMLAKTRRSLSEAPSSPPQMRIEDSSPVEHEAAPKKKRKRAETIKHRASTVEDTDATSTPAYSPPKSTRGGRGTNKAVGRMKAESRSRQESKETTADEEEDEGETEGVGEDEVEEDEEGTPSPKAPKPAAKTKAGASTTRKSRRKR